MEKTYTVFATGYPKATLFIKKGECNPEKYFFIKTIICDSSEIKKIAENIFNEEMKEFTKPTSKINVGDVITHSDGGKSHRGVVLKIKNNEVFLIFCTTNPNWNKKNRIATEEEKELFCFKSKTYITPVIKNLKELYKIGYSFPEYRIKEFLDEFIDEFFF